MSSATTKELLPGMALSHAEWERQSESKKRCTAWKDWRLYSRERCDLSPRRITRIEFHEGKGIIKVFVDFPRGSLFYRALAS
jgi:hypothetical protein